MQVSVEKARGLERKIKIQIPAAEVSQLENQRLNKIIKTAKMDGFRKGKVPLKIIEGHYGAQVRQEVLGEVIQNSLFKALAQEKLNPAVMPRIEETDYEEGKPLSYVAVFEVFPEITIKPFDKIKIEQMSATVTDADVAKTIETIRQQQKTWNPVQRAAAKGDQVNINFVGTIKKEAFEGGTAENFRLELGSGQAIPGFEEGITGMKVGEERTIDAKFPKDYGKEELAGKKAEFMIKLNAVFAPEVAPLDDDFAVKLGIKEGGLAALEKEVRKNMERELEQALKNKTKEQVMDALYEQNKVEVPKGLIDSEIEALKKQAERMYGPQMAMAGIADKSADYFEKQAQRRVSLGLLLSEIVKETDIKLDNSRVRKMVESIADAYEKPEEVVAMYYQNRDRLAQIESLILEEQVMEKVLESAKITEKKVAFSDIIKPQTH